MSKPDNMKVGQKLQQNVPTPTLRTLVQHSNAPRNELVGGHISVRRASRIARSIAESVGGVDAIFLYGSLARGDANKWSDLDLLVLGSRGSVTSRKLLSAIPQPDRASGRISLLYSRTPDFVARCKEGALFAIHVLMEGRILYDKGGILRNIPRKQRLAKVDIAGEVQSQMRQLAPYEDTQRFNGNFLFCLAHLYSIGKGIVMAGLARKGMFEFNRDAAFRRFVEEYPNAAGSVTKILELRPFYSLVNQRRPERLPYSYQNAEHRVADLVQTIKALSRAGT